MVTGLVAVVLLGGAAHLGRNLGKKQTEKGQQVATAKAKLHFYSQQFETVFQLAIDHHSSTSIAREQRLQQLHAQLRTFADLIQTLESQSILFRSKRAATLGSIGQVEQKLELMLETLFNTLHEAEIEYQRALFPYSKTVNSSRREPVQERGIALLSSIRQAYSQKVLRRTRKLLGNSFGYQPRMQFGFARLSNRSTLARILAACCL